MPNTPEKWAIQLTKAINQIHKLHGTEQFPVNVREVALEFSKQYYPTSRISDVVKSDSLSRGIEGTLQPGDNNEWAIIYRATGCQGRDNFTVAHELLHYLLHRDVAPKDGFFCSTEKVENWQFPIDIEREANRFAAFLLMPFDDFRTQIGNIPISLELIDHLANRYQVSRTATMLRWLEGCAKRAKLVYSIDDHISWHYCSKGLLKSSAYKNPKKVTLPVPEQSLIYTMGGGSSILHPLGVWAEEEEVQEISFSYVNNGLKIGVHLLIYPDEAIIDNSSPLCRIFDNDDESMMFDGHKLKW